MNMMDAKQMDKFFKSSIDVEKELNSKINKLEDQIEHLQKTTMERKKAHGIVKRLYGKYQKSLTEKRNLIAALKLADEKHLENLSIVYQIYPQGLGHKQAADCSEKISWEYFNSKERKLIEPLLKGE